MGMDYDPVDGVMVLFGGQENPGASPSAGCGTMTVMNDTWEYKISQPSTIITGPDLASSFLPTNQLLMLGLFSGIVVAGSAVGLTYNRKRTKNGKESVATEPATLPVCGKCNCILPEGSSYCGVCGSKLD
jgi:hypothetical protein